MKDVAYSLKASAPHLAVVNAANIQATYKSISEGVNHGYK